MWSPHSSQPSQHVCSLPAYSGGHLGGNPQASHSALLQTVWKVCFLFTGWYTDEIIVSLWKTFMITRSSFLSSKSNFLFLIKKKKVGLNGHLPLSCRYLQPPATWVQCALESRELLALCLKKIKSSMTKVSFYLTRMHILGRFLNWQSAASTIDY